MTKQQNNQTVNEPIPVTDNSPANEEDTMAIWQQEHISHET